MIAGEGGLTEKSIIHIYKAGCILHVSLVNNTSEYGLRYNRFAIQYIKDTSSNSNNQREKANHLYKIIGLHTSASA